MHIIHKLDYNLKRMEMIEYGKVNRFKNYFMIPQNIKINANYSTCYNSKYI